MRNTAKKKMIDILFTAILTGLVLLGSWLLIIAVDRLFILLGVA